MGADVVVDPAETSPYRAWQEAANPEVTGVPNPLPGPQGRPGVIFECVGVPGVIQQILEGAPHSARVVVVGVCMEPDRIEPMFGINKELNLQFVLGYTPDEFKATLGNLAAGRINAGVVVTGKVGLGGVVKAFEDLATPDRHAKILVEPWRV